MIRNCQRGTAAGKRDHGRQVLSAGSSGSKYIRAPSQWLCFIAAHFIEFAKASALRKMVNSLVFRARHQAQESISLLQPPLIDIPMDQRAHFQTLVLRVDAEPLQPPLTFGKQGYF